MVKSHKNKSTEKGRRFKQEPRTN